MRNFFLTILFATLPWLVMAQVRELSRDMNRNNRNIDKPQTTVIDNREKPPITAYKIISVENDTTFVDTTLTIQKDYKFNYLREDNFGLLPFANVGRSYTKLVRSFAETPVMPQFGARARHPNFMEAEDIYYYNVPTPLTELYFKTVFEQGQTLDAFFTVNTSPQLNLFVAYKGLRSLGRYQHSLTSTGNFRMGLSYHTKNKRYDIKTHFVSQDLMNEENGGLTPTAVQQYVSEMEEFDDRSLLAVRFQDAQNLLLGKRFYLDHYYEIVQSPDSISSSEWRVGHTLNFTDKEYHFTQTNASPYFGESYENTNLNDELEFQEVTNLVYTEYKNNLLGKFKAKASHINYKYGYNTLLILDENTIPNLLEGDILSLGGEYAKKIGGFNFSADAMLNLSGDFSGRDLKAEAAYSFSKDNSLSAALILNSRAPNYNFLLYQSDYKNYNWRNHYKNIRTRRLQVDLRIKKLFNARVSYAQINNYTYFGLVENETPGSLTDSLVSPFQYDAKIDYLKVKLNREFTYGAFSLNNTLLFQNVPDGENILKVPALVGRHSLYYRDYWFERALYLQMGFTANYFTNYEANGYDPVLAEFYVQDQQELNGFATLDFFFNAKVSQTRIFFKLENVTDLFNGNTNFSAPAYPSRDFSFRFGLVWNFFL